MPTDIIAQGLAIAAGNRGISALISRDGGPIYRCMEIGDSEIQLLGDARNNVFGVADSTSNKLQVRQMAWAPV